MTKHSLNILPEASPEDFALIRDDIKENGFNPAFPVVLYEGAILDGWNRYRACKELGIDPPTTTFQGTPEEAFKLVWSTNKRRNLTSSQRAAFAVEAESILKAIREDADKRKKAGRADLTQQIEQGSKNEVSTSARVAEMFNTNRTYVAKAEKLKEESPELFEKVKAGLVTITEATKPKPEPEPAPPTETREEFLSRMGVKDIPQLEEEPQKDSETVWSLKFNWKKARKTEKAAFLSWIRERGDMQN